MKKKLLIIKKIIKCFAKEKMASGLLEFLVMLCILAVVAALVSPVIKGKLTEMFDNHSQNITFGGEMGNKPINESPGTNPAPEVDTTVKTQ